MYKVTATAPGFSTGKRTGMGVQVAWEGVVTRNGLWAQMKP
jgi:hypothetical protein